METITLQHNTQEWIEFRKKGLGASEAAAAIGLSHWKTNTEVWEEKTGRRTSPDLSDNPRVVYGTEAEEYLINLFRLQYADRYNVTVNKTVVYRDGFRFASLDGELTEISTGALGVYEGKTVCVTSSQIWKDWNGRIPTEYYIQVLHQLLVTGREFVVLNAEFRYDDRDGEIKTECRRYRINRSDVKADLEYLDRTEKDFWRYVEEDKRPPLILPQI